MEKLLRTVHLGLGLLAVSVFLEVVLLLNQRTYHQEAVLGRQSILAMEQHNEQMLLAHMKRTVERWEALQHANPELNVKQVPEPVQ